MSKNIEKLKRLLELRKIASEGGVTLEQHTEYLNLTYDVVPELAEDLLSALEEVERLKNQVSVYKRLTKPTSTLDGNEEKSTNEGFALDG